VLQLYNQDAAAQTAVLCRVPHPPRRELMRLPTSSRWPTLWSDLL